MLILSEQAGYPLFKGLKDLQLCLVPGIIPGSTTKFSFLIMEILLSIANSEGRDDAGDTGIYK
ncbi:MAG TPA: hypothetical protein VLB84_11220 [Bacteroidia bacterium]|nr:hypothetical protein [Bacteroidia bacterium]